MMNFKKMSIVEMIIFGMIMVVFGFLVSYMSDFFYQKKIDWFPEHGLAMATGTFITSVLVFALFSNHYINYKCAKN